LESFCEALDCEPGDLIVRVKKDEVTTA
jgi:DNA-binding Xre family transcriptional regulator